MTIDEFTKAHARASFEERARQELIKRLQAMLRRQKRHFVPQAWPSDRGFYK